MSENGSESKIRDLCLKLGVGAPEVKRMRSKFAEKHGGKEAGEAAMVDWLETRWEEVRDRPRYPRAGGGSTHLGDEEHRWTDAEERGYTHDPRRSVEPGVEAVPDDYQREISERARRELHLVRRDELERRELRQLGSRCKDLAKRSPVGTDFGEAIRGVRESLDALERLAAEAA